MHRETRQELCESCPWGREIDLFIPWLYSKLLLQDAGCPLGRDELTDEEWHMLLDIRYERDNWRKEKAKKNAKHN